MPFKIEPVAEMPTSRRESEYTELYEAARALPIDGKLRVGPFDWGAAASVQTCLTGNVKSAEWKLQTYIRDEKGEVIPNSARPTCEAYVYFQKIRKV